VFDFAHPKFPAATSPKHIFANKEEHLSRQETYDNQHQHHNKILDQNTKRSPDFEMVAGKRVSPEKTARIRAYIEDTTNPLTNAAIANLMGVSTRTIERLRLNFELYDGPYPPTSVKLGRPTTLTEAQQAVIHHRRPRVGRMLFLVMLTRTVIVGFENSSPPVQTLTSQTPRLRSGNALM
jgi:hypothetical protein